MIIMSWRFRPGDMRHWNEMLVVDSANAKTDAYRRRVDEARSLIADFCARHSPEEYYIGLSYGKDSITVAHMFRQIEPRAQIISVHNVDTRNPDIPAVHAALGEMLEHDYTGILYDYANADASYFDAAGRPVKWHRVLDELARTKGIHVTGIRRDESSAREKRYRAYGVETPNSFAPLANMSARDVFSYLYENDLPIHPAYAMTDGGRWDKYRLRVSGIGHLEGTGMGRREWERLYYGDFLRRANAIRFSRGERLFPD